MPTHNFTLEDIEDLINQAFVKEREHTRELIQEVLVEERKRTHGLIQEAKDEITGQFTSFVEANFNPAIESLQAQITEVRDCVGIVEKDVREIKSELKDQRIIVNQHSRDIMELRAHTA